MTNPNRPDGRILVIEDEPELLEAMVTYLNMEGFVADGVAGLRAAEHWMRTHALDVLILDLGLADGDGLQWLADKEALRSKGVIITTARGESHQRIAGIQAGGDLYLVKPVQLEELSLLVGKLLRRLGHSAGLGWTVSRTDWTLRSPAGLSVKLTHSESTLLRVLAEKPGAVVTRQTLAMGLGHDPEVYDFRRLEILVRRLRQKVKTSLGCDLPLETVRKIGYAFTTSLQIQ